METRQEEMNASSLSIYPRYIEKMKYDVIAKQPEEACGLVFGIGNYVQSVVPITNILHSMSAFHMEPQEEMNALLMAENEGLNLLAVYHSHPGGIDRPSNTDYTELTFPNTVYIIWFYRNGQWQYNLFDMKP